MATTELQRHPATDHSVTSILGISAKKTESPVDLSGNERPRKRQRRNRTYFDDQALRVLEQAYEINNYPDVCERMKIAKDINEEEARIQIWFQNRRAREKRKSGVKASRVNKEKKAVTSMSQIPTQPVSVPINQEPVQHVSEQVQTMPNPSDILKLFHSWAAMCDTLPNQAYNPYWFSYNPYNTYHQFPDYPYTNFPVSYPPTPDNSDSSNQQAPQLTVLDLSKKKQSSPIWSPGAAAPTCSVFFDSPPKAVSPIPTSPQKENNTTDSYRCKMYTSSPISGRYANICLPSLYKSAFSPVTKLQESECRPADARSCPSTSSGKEESLSSNLLLECDIFSSVCKNDSDVIVLDSST